MSYASDRAKEFTENPSSDWFKWEVDQVILNLLAENETLTNRINDVCRSWQKQRDALERIDRGEWQDETECMNIAREAMSGK